MTLLLIAFVLVSVLVLGGVDETVGWLIDRSLR